MKSSNPTNETELDIQELDQLSSFFDLLARFDYEDKQKEEKESVFEIDSSVQLLGNQF